jgi:Holliday junction resolvase
VASNYKKGANRERQLAKRLELAGWTVTRSAGSRSPHDLVAIRPAKLFGGTATGIVEAYFIQVKTDERGPYAHFGPTARIELAGAATRAGAKAWLVWWPARREAKWIEIADSDSTRD